MAEAGSSSATVRGPSLFLRFCVSIIISRMSEPPRWWAFRRAQSLRPATYTCPFCGERLHAMSEHVVLAPEGEVSRRSHAHTECVLAERRAGRLPAEDEAR